MDENSTATETVPDLKDIEVKIGRKTPEGLLRWMREEATSLRGDAGKVPVTREPSLETGTRSLDEKIRKLRIEMAHLRSTDVKILQQLLALHEGIEAVKWLLEERSTLTSRCSSLTSSQYSLGEGPDTSWRGSWSSLQDPNDKLDNISVGSYLDTLADDMDEYCPSSSDQSILCSSTPQVSEATVAGRTLPKSGATKAVEMGAATSKPTAAIRPRMDSPKRVSSTPTWQKKTPDSSTKNSPIKLQSPLNKANGVTAADKNNATTAAATTGATAAQKGSPQHSSQSPSHKPYTNGKIDTDTSCKLNGKSVRLEYDAHWHWVQSQEDVTFL
ncbi:leucine rich adaptor protein 1 [Eucyclogobius newberryi]|uniref:leucine rich adaptor protein 1 n=1 Tax=Eucyclogobius newberryi TaxID=166745 RepID=UPI003B5C02F2